MLKAHLRLEGIKDGFDDEALAQHDLVSQGHQVVPHVPADTGDERLSELSSGTSELGAHVACFGVEANEKFVGEGDTDHLFWLAGEGQSAVEVGEIGIVPAHELSDDEQDRADAAAPAAD